MKPRLQSLAMMGLIALMSHIQTYLDYKPENPEIAGNWTQINLITENVWKLPGGPTYQQNVSQHIEGLVRNIDSHISAPTLYAMLEYQKVSRPSIFAFDDEKSPSLTKYSVYYLAYVTDSPLLNQEYMQLPDNLSQFINGKLKSDYFCRWSQIVELPFYPKHSHVLNFLYDPWKLQLAVDLDLTLLQSAQICILATYENANNHDIATPDDNLFKVSHLPELMINFQDYQQLRYVWTRPSMREFLQLASKLTDLTYWTAGGELMQKRILKELKIDHHARRTFYYDSCTLLPTGFPYKSFTDINHKLSTECVNYQYDTQRCILVDDSSFNYSHNPQNCYQIPPWTITKTASLEKLESCFRDNHLIVLMANLRKWSDRVIHEGRSAKELLEPYNKNTVAIPAVVVSPPLEPSMIVSSGESSCTSPLTQDSQSSSSMRTPSSNGQLEEDVRPRLHLTESFSVNLSSADLSQTDSFKPDSSQPDSSQPDSSQPDSSQMDLSADDLSPVDLSSADLSPVDLSQPEIVRLHSFHSQLTDVPVDDEINLSDANDSDDDDLPGYRRRLNQLQSQNPLDLDPELAAVYAMV